MLSFFLRGVLDEILNLIESVSEGFPSYFSTFYWLLNCTSNHIRFDLLLILAHARLPGYQNC